MDIDKVLKGLDVPPDLDRNALAHDLDWAETWYRVGTELRAGKAKRRKQLTVALSAAKRLANALDDLGEDVPKSPVTGAVTWYRDGTELRPVIDGLTAAAPPFRPALNQMIGVLEAALAPPAPALSTIEASSDASILQQQSIERERNLRDEDRLYLQSKTSFGLDEYHNMKAYVQNYIRKSGEWQWNNDRTVISHGGAFRVERNARDCPGTAANAEAWQRVADSISQELHLNERSAFEWLAGVHLPQIFKKHFHACATSSRRHDSGATVYSGAYLDFAEHALEELGITNSGKPYSRGAIDAALAKAGKSRRRQTERK